MSEIKRYCPEVGYPDHFAGMVESNEGAWVRYEDHQAALAAKREKHEALRQAVREKAREWEAESSRPLPEPCADEQQRPFIDGRQNACAEHAAELLALEKDHAG